MTKLFISSDIEGCAGIVDWQQVLQGGADYEMGRRLLLGEINAAIEGAAKCGLDEIVVNDSHSTMQNLDPEQLAGDATYISGRYKPLYMMQGLDSSFDAAFFIAYHGAIGGEPSVLSHTYNPRAIADVRLDGVVVGESAVNALVALHHEVPIVLVTGDRQTAEQARPFLPHAEYVVVKEAVSRFAAQSMHPHAARAAIAAGAERALSTTNPPSPPRIDLPAQLEIDFLTADMARMATWISGVTQTAERTVLLEGSNPLDLYQAFVAIIYLTRSIVEQT
ncbi:MAG: M55 family metallopeptidase [Actinomycetota bacterium]|nr:M55 family metallopeptidase [Actinomycetota bacterium]